jgi:hypothetical protein
MVELWKGEKRSCVKDNIGGDELETGWSGCLNEHTTPPCLMLASEGYVLLPNQGSFCYEAPLFEMLGSASGSSPLEGCDKISRGQLSISPSPTPCSPAISPTSTSTSTFTSATHCRVFFNLRCDTVAPGDGVVTSNQGP